MVFWNVFSVALTFLVLLVVLAGLAELSDWLEIRQQDRARRQLVESYDRIASGRFR